ncbi:MAG TPA: nucleotidyltransferase domain-containing protein [bacterium]|nr:nucleotidyltransferase domain-containing protein [bacterium]
MKTREEILSVLAEKKPGWERRFGLKSLALFGLFARGDQRESSDVDILVEVDASIGLEFVTLAEDIESSLGIPTEVVSRGAVKPNHWTVIERELLYV